MAHSRAIAVGLVLMALAGIGVWRYVAHPGEGPRMGLPGRPNCHDVVAVAATGGPEKLVCRSEMRSDLARAAKDAGCRLAAGKLPAVAAGDRVEVSRAADGLCGLRVAPLPGASLVALGLPIDVNRASEKDLEALPLVGPGRAHAIVEERKAHGPYRSVEDLERVKGIGPSTVKRLDGQVTIGAVGRPAKMAKPATSATSATAPDAGH